MHNLAYLQTTPNLQTRTFQTTNMNHPIHAMYRQQLRLLKPTDQKLETFEKVPDASVLLNSWTLSLVSGNDHASVDAAAVAECASLKPDSKGVMGLSSSVSVAPPPRAKLPRAILPHSKNFPDARGAALIPPQLKGRSNVVTEDISKLFVGRNAVAQPRGPEN